MQLRTFRHEARDDYLEAIMLIIREKGYCRSINIAEALEVSKPSVSVAVGKLQEEGLIELDGEKVIRLTGKGRQLAEETYAKHCYFKNFLLSVGVEEEQAEREACALEHAVSSESFAKIRQRYPEL